MRAILIVAALALSGSAEAQLAQTCVKQHDGTYQCTPITCEKIADQMDQMERQICENKLKMIRMESEVFCLQTSVLVKRGLQCRNVEDCAKLERDRAQCAKLGVHW